MVRFTQTPLLLYVSQIAEPKFFDHFRTCLYPQNVVQNTKGSIFCSLKTLGKGFRSTRTFKMHLKRASRDMNPNLDAVQFYILASFYPIKKLSCQFVPLMKRSRLARQIVIRLTPASASPVVRKQRCLSEPHHKQQFFCLFAAKHSSRQTSSSQTTSDNKPMQGFTRRGRYSLYLWL